MKILKQSQLNLFDQIADELISSAEASPVNPLVSPAKEKPKPMNAGSGRKLLELSRESDPLGYYLKTSLVLSLAGLTSLSLIWKLRATPSGRYVWVLGRLERHTEEIEYGLWPTCRATDADRGGRGDLIQAARENPNAHYKTWPTPESVNEMGYQVSNGKRYPRLGAVVRNQDWPTPAADNFRSRSGDRIGEVGLQRMAGWPLETASLGGANTNSKSVKENGHGNNLIGAVKEQEGNWPTPCAQDAEQAGSPKAKHKTLHRTVNDQEANWALPNSRDWKNASQTQGNRHSPNLNTEVYIDGPLDRERPSTNGSRKGSLNPAWVAQLMGYPPGWLDVDE